MLAFVFKFQSVALAAGCNRSQLVIAVKQASGRSEIPAKQALLWTAEWLLDTRPLSDIRAFFDEVLENPLRVSSVSDYLEGFLLALGFTDKVSELVVEVLSKAFATLPERVLITWLPSLLLTLRPLAGPTTTILFKEVAARFPRKASDLDTWVPPWDRQAVVPKAVAKEAAGPALSAGEEAARRLIFAWKEAGESLGGEGEWKEAMAVPVAAVVAEEPGVMAAKRLLQSWPEAAVALGG
jgi:hypothetical protein